jgi:hypothetical protein
MNIGQVSLEGRDPGLENVFDLRPGDGMHQPRNAPHWVETSDSVVVSYSISFETNLDRALSRTRGFNHYLRALRVPVTAPGLRPRVDAIKSALMRAAWR